MIGKWSPYYTTTRTYMRRRILWLFWQYREATDNECHASFLASMESVK